MVRLRETMIGQLLLLRIDDPFPLMRHGHSRRLPT